MGKFAELLAHPDEFLPMVRMYLASRRVKTPPKDPDLAFCYKILNAVSRSFSIVICQLPPELKDAACVFYLVLRALDTVEDDMSIDVAEKLSMLRAFYQKISDPDFVLDYGTGHYRTLLNEFPHVQRVLVSLDQKLTDVIIEITRRMGEGMAIYIEKEVKTIEDYDMYCFYVAGLVGIGLSSLFVETRLEREELLKREDLSTEMGLFLQKTNICRDYLEDIMEEPEPRIFWPKEVWGLYSNDLAEFKEISNRENALKCLNHLAVDSMRHIPEVFEYLEMVKTRDVFRFCAIPQIMSIATLQLCFDNGDVFEGVVKVRRGEICKIFESTDCMNDVYRYFDRFVAELEAKIPQATISAAVRENALKLARQVRTTCKERMTSAPPPKQSWLFPILAVLIVLVIFLVWFRTYSAV